MRRDGSMSPELAPKRLSMAGTPEASNSGRSKGSATSPAPTAAPEITSIQDFFATGASRTPPHPPHPTPSKKTSPGKDAAEVQCPFQAIMGALADSENLTRDAEDGGSTQPSLFPRRETMAGLAINERFPVSNKDLKRGLEKFELHEEVARSKPIIGNRSPVAASARTDTPAKGASNTAEALMCPASGALAKLALAKDSRPMVDGKKEGKKEGKRDSSSSSYDSGEAPFTKVERSSSDSTAVTNTNTNTSNTANSADAFSQHASVKSKASSGDMSTNGAMRYAQSGIPSRGNRSRRSRTSQESGEGMQVPRNRRVRRGGMFSAYEASNYEPIIRKSWELLKVRSQQQGSSLGVILYKHLFEQNADIHFMFTSSNEVMAEKFLLVFEDIVAAVEDPVAMSSKLKGLAPMHLKKGVKPEHTDKMGAALYSALHEVLGAEYNADVKAAWEWLWSWLSQVMAQSLEDAINEATVLTYSWDLALDNNTEDEMGNLLFDTLFELAPNLKSVYRKPRQILSSKFVEMMSTLVSFHGDPMRMEEQITWLGFRHIKYGAKAEHVKVLGDVIVETLARAVEEDWTMEMADAWSELWTRASTQMFKVINEAKVNGVLVQEMWELVQMRTTEIKFGSTLRKLLLSGTEWVSSLSYGILESSTPAKDSLKSTLDFKSAAPATPATKGATMDSATPGKLDKGTTFKSIFHNDEMFEDKSSESDAIGRYFWTMLTELLTLLWEPEQQNERMIVMTTHLFHWGIRSKHLPTIGDAIGNACKRVLKADWSKEMHDGWQWWWSVTSKQMVKTLYVCEQDHARIICESWALCKERSSTLQLGELFFKELARMAPHIMHLFKRPKVIQAAQFVAVVDMLVTFVENPALFFEGFKALTIRHIKYGVKAEYAKAFGKSILIGIEKTLGEDNFDEETREVWQMLWMRASSCVGRALNVGTNPVIVSLVQGDVDKMSKAISCAERCNRFQWLTSVDINGEKISPIYWSLRDGNPMMVRYIMFDLLTLRADRDKYYYGREVLFEEHADIVTLLCRECPDLLLETLFSGLMWHSKEVENGSLRVNYYIRELYGDPNKETNVWKQALAVMVTEGSPDMFRHPLSQKLLEVKWSRFGIKCFLGLQAVYVILLILFMIGSVQNYEECSYKPLRYFVGVASFLLLTAQGFICFRHWRSGLISKSHLLFGLQVPSWISDTCNSARVSALIFIVTAVFFDSCDWVQPDSQGNLTNPNKFVGMALNAFAAVLLWSQVLQIMVLSTRLAALTYTIGIMAEDVTRNLLVVGFFVAAFSTALTALREDHFPTFGQSLLVLVRVILNVDPPSLHDLTPLGIFFFFMFIITAIVGMLNILIAQLWSSYGQVASNKLGYALQHRANICMHMESVMPTRWRLMLFDEMFFDTNVPFNQGDAGPSGGIQVIEPASVRNSPCYVPDRILRFTGEASPNDPWPVELGDDGAAQGFGASSAGYSGKGTSSHGR